MFIIQNTIVLDKPSPRTVAFVKAVESGQLVSVHEKESIQHLKEEQGLTENPERRRRKRRKRVSGPNPLSCLKKKKKAPDATSLASEKKRKRKRVRIRSRSASAGPPEQQKPGGKGAPDTDTATATARGATCEKWTVVKLGSIYDERLRLFL